MSCLSNILRNKRKDFFLTSMESVALESNKVILQMNNGIGEYIQCMLLVQTEPYCFIRLWVGAECEVSAVETVGGEVSLDVGKKQLRVSGGDKVVLVIDYRPWKLMVFYKNQLCTTMSGLCTLGKSNSVSVVTEIVGTIYGLPERASGSRLLVGHQYRLHNTDEFGLAVGTDKPLYGSVPFVVVSVDDLHKSRNSAIGLLSQNPSGTTVSVKKRLISSTRLRWVHDVGPVDLLCLPAQSCREVRMAFLSVTKVPTPMPPLFAIGYHQCRWNYDDDNDLLEVDRRLKEAGIPCDVLWLDIEHTDGKRYFTWNREKFDPIRLLENLKSSMRHLVVIIDPHLKEDTVYQIYKEAFDAEYLVKNEDGSVLIGECWPGNSSWVDFINENACSWWSDKICNYLKDFGCTAESNNLWIWNDMNEPSVFKCPDNQMRPTALHAGGLEHRAIHNIYGQRMASATWNGILKASNYNLRPFLLSRSFFTGSQKYGAIWTGDSLSCWDHLRVSVPMMLSLSICGIEFCGADVGGFLGDPDPELLCRWYQLGSFQPFFRAHAHIESRRREPYLIDEPYQRAIKNAICLRYKLLSYWYLCFWLAETTLLPVISPLWMAFPEYCKKPNDDCYMIGTDILLRPMLTSLCTSVSLTLPGTIKDKWYRHCNIDNVWQVYNSAKKLKVSVDIESIPVFYRGGSCLFLKEGSVNHTEEWRHLAYHIMMFPASDCSCSGLLYVDDYRSFDYRTKGFYGLYRCSLDTSGGIVTMTTEHRWEGLPVEVVIDRITILKGACDGVFVRGKRAIASNKSFSKECSLGQFADRVEVTGLALKMPSDDWTVRIEE